MALKPRPLVGGAPGAPGLFILRVWCVNNSKKIKIKINKKVRCWCMPKLGRNCGGEFSAAKTSVLSPRNRSYTLPRGRTITGCARTCKYNFSLTKSFVISLPRLSCYVLNFASGRTVSPRTFRKKLGLVQTWVTNFFCVYLECGCKFLRSAVEFVSPV